MIFSVFVFPSCKDEDPQDLGPNILVTVQPLQEYYVVGDTLIFQISLSAINGINDFDIRNVKNNTSLFSLSESDFLNATSRFLNAQYFLGNDERSGDTTLLQFLVIDTKQLSRDFFFEYKVAEPIIIDTLIFGDQLNPDFGNCLSLSDRKLFILSEAVQNAEKIDFIFYKDSVLNWVVLSPNVGGGNDSLINELSNFSIRRDTRFNSSLITSNQFTTINNDGTLLELDTIPQSRYLDSISTTTVLYFIDQDLKLGALRLSNFQDTLGNFGTVEIKVQQ